MPGLLDFLNSPEAQQGLSLLDAGLPTADPNQTGLSQRMAAGVNYAQARQTAQLQQQQMAQQKFAWLQKLMGDTGVQSGQQPYSPQATAPSNSQPSAPSPWNNMNNMNDLNHKEPTPPPWNNMNNMNNMKW